LQFIPTILRVDTYDTAMVVATIVKSLPDISKIEPFNGTHFK